MSRCDFGSIITLLQKNAKNSARLSQEKAIELLFNECYNQKPDTPFDKSIISKWLNGTLNISDEIIGFYTQQGYDEYLASDIEEHIFPLLNDIDRTVEELYSIVIGDTEISERTKNELTSCYPFSEDYEKADFFARVLIFTMEHKSKSQIAKMNTALSAESPIIGCKVPEPCKHFCGRDNELAELNEKLKAENKVFLQGIAGIGKSELAKAYVKKYKKNYTNTYFLPFSNTISSTLTDIQMTSDRESESRTDRLEKHLRYLHTLKSDSLIILDGFNVVAGEDEYLDELLNLDCSLIITTSCVYDEENHFELNEIADMNDLLSMFRVFYSKTDFYKPVIKWIIRTLHSHTLSVEMAARLLMFGMITPFSLLIKLHNGGNPKSSENIRIKKDGAYQSDSFFQQLRKLFSLFKLSENEQFLMRCMAFVPFCGIDVALFAELTNLNNGDILSVLCDKGFIKYEEGALVPHAIISDVTISDLRPSTENCRPLLENVHSISLEHGKEIGEPVLFAGIVSRIVKYIAPDDMDYYIRFLEDAFAGIEKYQPEPVMQQIISELESLMDYLSQNDIALLFDLKAAYSQLIEGDYEKALELEQNALEQCDEAERPALAANIHDNLSLLYMKNDQPETARKHMDEAIRIMSENHIVNNDLIGMAINKAGLDSPVAALQSQLLLAKLIKDRNTDMCEDYADCIFNASMLFLQLNDKPAAVTLMEDALRIYSQLPNKQLYQNRLQILKKNIRSLK